jgi:hypothetical protein
VVGQGIPIVVVQGPSSWLSFWLDTNSRVMGIGVGAHDFAAGKEYCVGAQYS